MSVRSVVFMPISFTSIFKFLGNRQKISKVESIKLVHFEVMQCSSEIRPSLDFDPLIHPLITQVIDQKLSSDISNTVLKVGFQMVRYSNGRALAMALTIVPAI